MAFALLVTATLASCGRRDEEGGGDTELDARNEATEVGAIFNASPEALASPSRVDLPQDADTAEATIKDGKLDPDTIEGQSGLPFILTVTGDGQDHTLAIQGLVAETPIKAQGDTQVPFTVSGEPGDKEILLDGKEAGTFRVQAPSGGTQ